MNHNNNLAKDKFKSNLQNYTDTSFQPEKDTMQYYSKKQKYNNNTNNNNKSDIKTQINARHGYKYYNSNIHLYSILLALLLCLSMYNSMVLPAEANLVLQLKEYINLSYKLGDGFLNLVRGNNDAIDVNIDIKGKNTQQLSETVVKNSMTILPCFLILLFLGLSFMICMPFCGLCVCCFRCCCGCCGAYNNLMDSRHAKCKRVCCNLLLFITATLILCCIALACLNNYIMHEAFINKDPQVNAFLQVNKSFGAIAQYTNDIQKKLSKKITIDDNDKKDLYKKMSATIDQFRDDVKQDLAIQIILRDVKKVAEANGMEDTLPKNLESYWSLHTGLVRTVPNALLELQNALGKCGSIQCKQLRENIMSGTVDRSIQPSYLNDQSILLLKQNWKTIRDEKVKLDRLIAFGVRIEDIPKTVNPKIKDNIKNALDQFGKAENVERIRESIQRAVKSDYDSMYNMLSRYLQHNSPALEDSSSLTLRNRPVNLIDLIVEYETFRLYLFVGFGCILLLTVIFYYKGIAFGVCGERPYEDAGICNSGVGANLLIAGVACSFIFSALIMLVVSLMFAYGATVQMTFCNNVSPSNGRGATQDGLNYMDNIVLSIANVTNSASKGLPVSSKDYMRQYNEIVLQRNSVRNNGLSQSQTIILNTHMRKPDHPLYLGVKSSKEYRPFYGLYWRCPRENIDILDALPVVSIIPKRALGDPVIKELNLEKEKLSRQFTAGDIKQLIDSSSVVGQLKVIDKLDMAVNQIPFINYERTRNFLQAAKLALESNQATTPIMNTNKALDDLKLLEPLCPKVYKGVKTMAKLLKARFSLFDILDTLRTDPNAVLIKPAEYAIERQKNVMLRGLLDKALKGTKCSELGNSVQALSNTMCITILQPFNGLWESMGLALWLLIPAIIFALTLVRLYRNTEEYCSDYEEPDYMSYQGFYINPNEHIPMDRSSRKRC